MIQNKFLIYPSKQDFLIDYDNGIIRKDAIVFIEGTHPNEKDKSIFVNGTYYSSIDVDNMDIDMSKYSDEIYNLIKDKINIKQATVDTLGTIRLGLPNNDTSRTYGLKVNSNGQAYVTVPWVSGNGTTTGPVQGGNNRSFKNTVFCRSNTQPITPTGGDWNNPIPTPTDQGGVTWYDTIPLDNANKIVWVSSRTFTEDGKYPQDDFWSTPANYSTSNDLQVRYNLYNGTVMPSAPDNNGCNVGRVPLTDGTTKDEWLTQDKLDKKSPIWMAIRYSTNGIWGNWVITRISGEKGTDGNSIKVVGDVEYLNAGKDGSKTKSLYQHYSEENVNKSYLFKVTDNTPDDEKQYDNHLIILVDFSAENTIGQAWFDIGGIKGTDGKPGDPGKNGLSAYYHVKFTNDDRVLTKPIPTDIVLQEEPAKYMGYYVDQKDVTETAPEDSTNPNDYTWTKFEGQDGFGYQYIYTLSSVSQQIPCPPYSGQTTTDNGVGWNGGKYNGVVWYDNQPNVSEKYPFCYRCWIRTDNNDQDATWNGVQDGESNKYAILIAHYGKDGNDGTDGLYQENIYKRVADSTVDVTRPTESSNTAGFLPEGWTDHPSGITEQFKLEYICTRKKDPTSDGGVWSDWTDPVIWSKWGEAGKDGDGVSYIFKRTIDTNIPDSPTGTGPDVPKDDGWTDNPTGVNAQHPIEWVSSSKSDNGIWSAWSTPAIWANYSKNGQSLYTWIKYADALADGTQYPNKMYDNPTSNTTYIGISYNNKNVTESEDPHDYTWSKWTGPKGEPGDRGPMGASIKIKGSVANEAALKALSGSFEVGDAYITEDNGHIWVYAEDKQWKDLGVFRGNNGTSAYVHMAYSTTNDGRQNYSTDDSTGRAYIGIFSDSTESDPVMVEGSDGRYVGKTTEDEKRFTYYIWTKILGSDGQDGQDGITILLDNNPALVSLDKDGTPQKTNNSYAKTTVSVYKGGTKLPDDQIHIEINQGVHCTANLNQNTILLTAIQSTGSNNQYYTEGYVDLNISINGYADATFKQKWEWHSEYTKYFQRFINNETTFDKKLEEVTDKVGEYDSKMSEIKQTTDEISLTVRSSSTPIRNLLSNSYFNAAYNSYGICTREFKPTNSVTYIVSCNYYVTPAFAAGGNKLKLSVAYKDTDGNYVATAKELLINNPSTTPTTVYTYFTVPANNTYPSIYMSLYPTSSDTSQQYSGDGLIVCNWMQLEESYDANLIAPTPWTQSADDPQSNPNLIPDVAEDWLTSAAKNTQNLTCELLEDSKISLGKILHAKYMSTTDNSGVDILSTPFTPKSNETYTLSFRAKGTGEIRSFLYKSNDTKCVQGWIYDGVVHKLSDDNDGDGQKDTVLTSDWKQYSVTWAIRGSKEQNVLPCRVLKNTEVWLCDLKLEQGGRVTQYIPKSSSKYDEFTSSLIATGIQINDKKITVTADNFNIKTNTNKLVLGTDASGQTTIKNLTIGGMLSKTPIEITSDNQDDYIFYGDTIQMNQATFYADRLSGIMTMSSLKSDIIINSDHPLNLPSLQLSVSGTSEDPSLALDGALGFKNESLTNEQQLLYLRSLVGNTILIYNQTEKDLYVSGYSSIYQTITREVSSTKSVTSAVRANGNQTRPSQPITGTVTGLEAVIQKDPFTPKLYEYIGKQRQYVTLHVKPGGFVSATCVAEVNSSGYECVYFVLDNGMSFMPAWLAA